MATKVVMEALSPTMEEGRLVKWLKNEGDVVKSGETLAEVETDKAIMELVARGDGVLRKRLVGEGDSRPVGQLVGVIAGPDENIDALIAGAGAPPAGEAKPAEQVVAKTQEQAGASPVPRSPTEAQGEASTPPQEKAPPAAPPQPAPQAAAPPASSSAQGGANAGNGGPVRSSPLARRLASERGLDLSQVRGSGPAGRIIKRDIETAVSSGLGTRQSALGAAGAQAESRVPSAESRVSREGDYEDVALTQIRKTIARRLAES